MTVPSDFFSISWDPNPRLTGHWRSLTSSTVPLKVASVALSYLGIGSPTAFCQAAVDRVARSTAEITSNPRQVFMFRARNGSPKCRASGTQKIRKIATATTSSGWRMPTSLFRFPNFHVCDQAVSKRVDVLHHLVGKQFAAIVMDDLVNIHADAAILFGFEIYRRNVGLD